MNEGIKDPTVGEDLKIIELRIENYKGIKAFWAHPAGKPLKISGPNGSGKTSVVDAIYWCLKASALKDVSEPIRHGAQHAEVELDLGEYRVIRTAAENGSRLKVLDRLGRPIKEPQKMLDGLLSHYCLDPIAFLEQRGRDQIDDLLAVCGVEPPTEAVQRIAGDVIEEMDKGLLMPIADESADQFLMRLSADETGLFYIRRREMSRRLDEKRAARQDERKLLDSMGGPLRNAEEIQSPSAIVERLNELMVQRESARDANRQVKELEGKAQEGKRQLGSIRREILGIEEEMKRLADEIERISVQLEKKRATLADLLKRDERGEEVVQGLVAKWQAADTEAKVIGHPETQIAECQKRLDELDVVNQTLVRRQHVAEQVERLAVDVELATRQHERLDRVLEELRNLRRHLLDGVELGISGLEIGDGELRLNGAPFRQASQAEQLAVAVAVAARQNPRLKLLRLDNSEHLDGRHVELILECCRRHGLQPIRTVVADTDGLCAEIEDGE